MNDKFKAIEFLNSMRGQFIVSQSLYLAIKEINSRPQIEQEPSNVADMEYLLNNLFPIYKAVAEANAHFKQHKNSVTPQA